MSSTLSPATADSGPTTPSELGTGTAGPGADAAAQLAHCVHLLHGHLALHALLPAAADVAGAICEADTLQAGRTALR